MGISLNNGECLCRTMTLKMILLVAREISFFTWDTVLFFLWSGAMLELAGEWLFIFHLLTLIDQSKINIFLFKKTNPNPLILKLNVSMNYLCVLLSGIRLAFTEICNELSFQK